MREAGGSARGPGGPVREPEGSGPEPDGAGREPGGPVYEPGGVLDSRPERRGLNRLVRTGWRRAARSQPGAPAGLAHTQASAPGTTPLRLRVELVPKTSWYADVRELLDEETWVRIVALCPDCHTVQHMGFANLHGGGTQARAHLARINGWSLARTDAHIADAFRLWAQRNHQPWILDLEGLRPYLAAAEYARVARRAAIPPTGRS